MSDNEPCRVHGIRRCTICVAPTRPRLGSLCSGAGGLDMAVEALFGARTVWHCETDRAASTILAARWPGVPNHGDLTAADWSAVEPIDILAAGWPCQPFSAAGKRKGADDHRAIWPHVARAVRLLRPRIVVLENVSAVLGPEFHRVADSLAEVGMHVWWTCLRASEVGAPHRRERLFVVAYADRGRLTQRAELDGEPARSELKASLGRDVDRRHRHAAVTTLLPTPAASDGAGGKTSRSGDRIDELLLGGLAKAYADGALLPTPAAADGIRGQDYARAERDGSGGDDLVTLTVKAHNANQWGKYAAAIQRWEAIVGPAPSPTEPNRNGNPRLNPAFSEWMMGWAAGWVTAVPGVTRNDQLRAIGNGVCPQQAYAALDYLVNLAEREAVS